MRIRAAGGDPNADQICGRCRNVLPLTAFYPDTTATYGRSGWCRLCVLHVRKASYRAMSNAIASSSTATDSNGKRDSTNEITVSSSAITTRMTKGVRAMDGRVAE